VTDRRAEQAAEAGADPAASSGCGGRVAASAAWSAASPPSRCSPRRGEPLVVAGQARHAPERLVHELVLNLRQQLSAVDRRAGRTGTTPPQQALRGVLVEVVVVEKHVVRTGLPGEPVLPPLDSMPEPVPAPEAVTVSVGGSEAVSEATTARLPAVGSLPPAPPTPRPGPCIEGRPVPTPRPRVRSEPEPVRGEPVDISRPRPVDWVSGPSRVAAAAGDPLASQRRPRHAAPSPTPYARPGPEAEASSPTGELSVLPVPSQREAPLVSPRHGVRETDPVMPGGARRDGATGSATVRPVRRYDDPPPTGGPGRVQPQRPDQATLDPRHQQEDRSGPSHGTPPMPADPDDPRWEVSA
jgi:hypothetical protein